MVGRQQILAEQMPLYDRAHLASFTGGDVIMERGLVREFCHNAREQLSALCDAGTARRWRECAHKLKGAARGIGCWQIAMLCETAERLDLGEEMARRHITGQITALLDQLVDAVA